MLFVNTANRSELEAAVMEFDILPVDSPGDLAAIMAMDTEALRAAVAAWVEAGDETA